MVSPISATAYGPVAIAIVAFRNPDDVSACLAALDRSTYRNFTVYICENGGEAAYQTLAHTVPDRLPSGPPIVVINAGENLGYAGGVNRCIAASAANYRAIWVLNPDTEPEPTALEAMLERLSQGDVEAVGGIVLWTDDVVQSYGGVWKDKLGLTASIGMGERADAPVDTPSIETQQNFICGASMLVSDRFIDRVGLMREDFFLYAEEVEWCLRARSKGVRLGFASKARVRHHRGSTTGWTPTNWPKMPIYLDTRNRLRLVGEHQSLLVFLCAIMIALIQSVWRYGRRSGGWRPVIYTFLGAMAALRKEAGRPSWIPSTAS